MSQSLFDGLSLARTDGRIEISYPCAMRDLAHAEAVARAHGLQVRAAGGRSWHVGFDAERPYPAQAKQFFAQLNDHGQSPLASSVGATPREPLVSCIVVVNENLPFVDEQLLPSLASSSAGHAIEVILVCNGSVGCEPRAGLRVLRSEWGVVSKAYNAGAAAARGTYLAFFHDDCVLQDARWIEKCLQRLEHGAHAVAAEYRQISEVGGVPVPPLPVAKCVPLFLKKADFIAAGGYDEQHYIGYEDLDFTLALAAHGRKLVATDLRVLHFHGMSSTLKYNPVPGLADLYALGAVPGFAIVRRFNEFWRTGLVSDGVNFMRLAMDAQLLYVLQKYRPLLGRIDGPAYARAEAALEERIARGCEGGPRAALARLRALDRQVQA